MNCDTRVVITFMNIINTHVAHFSIFYLWTQFTCTAVNYYKQNNLVYENMTKQNRKK